MFGLRKWRSNERTKSDDFMSKPIIPTIPLAQGQHPPVTLYPIMFKFKMELEVCEQDIPTGRKAKWSGLMSTQEFIEFAGRELISLEDELIKKQKQKKKLKVQVGESGSERVKID